MAIHPNIIFYTWRKKRVKYTHIYCFKYIKLDLRKRARQFTLNYSRDMKCLLYIFRLLRYILAVSGHFLWVFHSWTYRDNADYWSSYVQYPLVYLALTEGWGRDDHFSFSVLLELKISQPICEFSLAMFQPQHSFYKNEEMKLSLQLWIMLPATTADTKFYEQSKCMMIHCLY